MQLACPARLITAPSAILVVDDDADIRSLIRTFLEHEGYHVYTSGDANRAAQIFRRAAHIDLLLTDYYMPYRSGMDLALEIKSIQPTLPILMMSGAYLGHSQLHQLRTEGWNFLAKPFTFPQLLANIHEILNTTQAITT
jgi:two-component system, chemotaxis family, chemotaxis protein CheY